MSESRLSKSQPEEAPPTPLNVRQPFPKMEPDYGPDPQVSPPVPVQPPAVKKTKYIMIAALLATLVAGGTYYTIRHYLQEPSAPAVDQLIKEVWPHLDQIE